MKQCTEPPSLFGCTAIQITPRYQNELMETPYAFAQVKIAAEGVVCLRGDRFQAIRVDRHCLGTRTRCVVSLSEREVYTQRRFGFLHAGNLYHLYKMHACHHRIISKLFSQVAHLRAAMRSFSYALLFCRTHTPKSHQHHPDPHPTAASSSRSPPCRTCCTCRAAPLAGSRWAR